MASRLVAAVPGLLSYSAARGLHCRSRLAGSDRVLCNLSPFGCETFTASKNGHWTKQRIMPLGTASPPNIGEVC